MQKEYSKGLFDADTILCEWKDKTQNNRDAYLSLYKQVTNFDKHIAKRYDKITGSNYLFIIAAQLYNCVISENDLTEFSNEIQQAIKMIANINS